MAVYSAVLAHLQLADGDLVTAYTVPAGIVAVVRDMTAKSMSGSSATISIRVVSGLVTCDIWDVRLVDSFLTSQWQGREVLNPGDVLQVASLDGACSVRISGYELGG